MPYHLVCRDCCTERVFDERGVAHAEQELHASLHDHTVMLAEVEPPQA